ncbi:MAG TPA: hypothetical protein VMT32_08455 [Bryobacteraceae bacterium]|nr:hypothetical protein [Bryobacteraceae bacterium]
MGFYSEYLDTQIGGNFEQLTSERKRLLTRISSLRGGRDIFVFAADLNKEVSGISIGYPDLLPISDQIANLTGRKLDLILESPGGSGEVAEEVVRLLRSKYDEVGVIVPGWAKSAGTIIAMAADEILMGPTSALGPIDAQISWQGKRFSADALLEGIEKIKREATSSGQLNRAYIPILQGISPGEIQSAENALKFAKILVTDWLARYKFRGWTFHSASGSPVTDEDRNKRAEEIADRLCDHKHWLTHGRSIKIEDLEAMRLKITDYSKDPQLGEAISRYYTLVQMTFATNIYKIFETPTSQIYRFVSVPIQQQPAEQGGSASVAVFDLQCGNCKSIFKIQANLGKQQPLRASCLPFPKDNKFTCPRCGIVHDLSDARRQVEAQAKLPIV